MGTNLSVIEPSTFDAANKALQTIAKNDLLNKFVRLKGLNNNNSIIHLHCCRSGPVLANEIFISINEKSKRPELEKIYGITQPGATLSKYLVYWYGGLDKQYIIDFFSNIKFENKTLINSKDNNLDPSIFFSDPSNLFITWSHGVKVMIEPLIKKEALSFLDILEISEPQLLEELYSNYKDSELVSFKDFLERASLFLANRILKKKSLPEIFLFEAADFVEDRLLRFKFINTILAEESLRLHRIKRERVIKHTIFELKKRLRGYIFCTKEQFSIIFDTLSKKSNRAVAQRLVSLENAENICLNGKSITDILSDDFIIQDLIDSNKILSKSVSDSGQIKYVTGADMIEVCFKAADIHQCPLVLQKFFREGGYEKYQEMLDKYSNVNTDKSSIDIWNTEIFPEYDLNIFKAVEYLR
jgi:hypothetical protein